MPFAVLFFLLKLDSDYFSSRFFYCKLLKKSVNHFFMVEFLLLPLFFFPWMCSHALSVPRLCFTIFPPLIVYSQMSFISKPLNFWLLYVSFCHQNQPANFQYLVFYLITMFGNIIIVKILNKLAVFA